jgi:hypothetical protein
VSLETLRVLDLFVERQAIQQDRIQKLEPVALSCKARPGREVARAKIYEFRHEALYEIQLSDYCSVKQIHYTSRIDKSASLRHYFLPHADQMRRNSHDHFTRTHRSRHDGTGTYHAAIAQFDVFQNNRFRADPATVPN